ncbi:MAG: 16S rRNA (uracil(1498)-N(3))-methyltransferase [Myxococcales bacterium]|nr:16S rRNA (uracil(1498)-N(3))-methyltransferase [Myxococcales bacterium]
MIRARVPAALLRAGGLRLVGPEHHYLTRVRRARVGESVELFDGEGGCASAVISGIDGEGCDLVVAEVQSARRAGALITALVPLLKGERMDQCVEKLVEVGCDRLVLWQAARSVVRLSPGKDVARVERISAQVAAAVRQSGQAVLPRVEGIWSLAEVIERCAEPVRIVLDPAAQPLAPGLCAPAQAVALLSGPEGGLAPSELETLVAAGFSLASLTDTVLRAETAPVVAVALWRWAERPSAPTG